MKQPRAGGTADTTLAIAFQPSLRDKVPKRVHFPGVETPGYYQASPDAVYEQPSFRLFNSAIVPSKPLERIKPFFRVNMRNNSGPSG